MTEKVEREYLELYQKSIDQPEIFWDAQAKNLTWIKPYQKVLSGNLEKGNIKWFEGGKLNISVNCIDRHLEQHADKTALIWQSDCPDKHKKLTFKELHVAVGKFANLLKYRNIKKGDRVCLYMPMILEAAIAMLACARIGAVHNVVFGGFSPESLQKRINASECCCVITADVGMRGGKTIQCQQQVDTAIKNCPSIHSVIVINTQTTKINYKNQLYIDYYPAIQDLSHICEPEIMDAEDPLFILYTSGSTGTPKGIVHTTAGYLLYAMTTFKNTFAIEQDDVYWCTADVGWITGHSYVVYGPLASATTSLMFEGVPNYPDDSRFWQIVDQHKVSVFYTAPTAIRSIMKHGDQYLNNTTRNSLRVLGTVGEPINPEAWDWYFNKVGNAKCPIMDTWWQTETGGFILAPPFDIKQQKPGAAMRPALGIEVNLVNSKGEVLTGNNVAGDLVISKPWPGMMRTLYNNHERYMDAYFNDYPGHYLTGDGAKRDEDGDYWITGRTDDVLNISGHRIGTAEVESALVLHKDVAEAAVVGIKHEIKGEGMHAFVSLMDTSKPTDSLRQELIKHVRQQIGPIATIDLLQFSPSLPKTRSGKIMRRILRKIANHDTAEMGDTSTLANPECVDKLIEANL